MAAIIAAVLAVVVGGGNGERNFNAVTSGESFVPQTLIEHDDDLRSAATFQVAAQIEATPTASTVAIAPAVAAVQTSTVKPVTSLPLANLENCPAVIVETFGAAASAACAVAWCESRYDPHAVGDSGNSLGWFQLWTGWASWYGVSVDALFDPATNAAVASAVLEYRGRWGGKGGWTCADLLGIP